MLLDRSDITSAMSANHIADRFSDRRLQPSVSEFETFEEQTISPSAMRHSSPKGRLKES
jgi:hypothetical protein